MYAETEKQVNISLAMINTERVAGTTAPALLKGYRAKVLAISALSLESAGRYSEALPLYIENVDYYESIDDNEELVSALTSLGVLYCHQGVPKKALALAQRAQLLNPRNAESLAKLGALLSALTQLDEALVCFQKALGCEEREHGKNTLRYASLLGHIGTGYSDLGHCDIALSWYHRARAEYEKLDLTTSHHFGLLLHNIGVAYSNTNNFSEALLYFTRAEAFFRGVLPPDHPTFTNCMRGIAEANTRLGNVDAAAAAAATADITARRSQVQCTAAGCPRKLKADGTSLDQCGGYKRCCYCSKACQTADWKAGHKAECKALSINH